MSRWNEREIVRKLAERDELEPPAGLLEKIKGEIPPTIPVGVPRLETRRPVPSSRRWLIAASLVAMVGAGFFGLRVQREAPPPAASAAASTKLAGPTEKDLRAAPEGGGRSAVPPDALQRRLGEARQPQQALPVPPPPPPLLKKDQEALKALGYSGPPVREQRLQAGVVGGVAGGAVAAPPPAAPVAAPQPKPQPHEETNAVVGESVLRDERRAAKAEPAAPAVRDPWAVLQKTPGVLTDRINVGGNEKGQQSEYVGPGQPFVDVAAHPVSTFRLNAGTAFGTAARDLKAGKRSEAVPNRADAPVQYYDFDDFSEKPARGAVAITAEGAPTPYVRGPRFRLLRFHLDGVAAGAQELVVFDPAVVVQYRPIDGDGADVLYEIELRSDLPQEGMVAALFLKDPPYTSRELALSALAPSWEQASPDFRLSALAARFLDTLKNRPGAKEELARIVRQMREIGKQPGGARAAGLADRMEKTAGKAAHGGE